MLKILHFTDCFISRVSVILIKQASSEGFQKPQSHPSTLQVTIPFLIDKKIDPEHLYQARQLQVAQLYLKPRYSHSKFLILAPVYYSGQEQPSWVFGSQYIILGSLSQTTSQFPALRISARRLISILGPMLDSLVQNTWELRVQEPTF